MLRVTDNDQQIDEDSATVLVGDVPPVADAGGPYNADVDETITFDASDSYDPDGTIDQYAWDWDNDGIYDDSSVTPSFVHSWASVGNYTVVLRVIDNDLQAVTDSADVTRNE